MAMTDTPIIRRLFTGDNLDILRGLNSDSVDLVYLDPPFNSNRNYAAPIGSAAEGSGFKDVWTLDDVVEAEHGLLADRHPALFEVIAASRLAHSPGMMAYLTMMGSRLLELRRVMKPTGSIYLHCDPTANSYLRLVMDAIFGRQSFRNEIVWWYKGNSEPAKNFPAKHDSILFYAGPEQTNINRIGLPYAPATIKRYNHEDEGGRYKISALRNGRQEKVYMKSDGKACDDVWEIPVVRSKQERTGWATQKPLALLERIISASSNPGDVVLDPFCGCATACLAAEKLGRSWIGIDLSPLARKLVQSRLSNELGLDGLGIDFADEPPVRTDLDDQPLPKATAKHELYGKQEGNCAGCLVHFPYRNLTIDHIVPSSRGGADHPSNYQLLCGACNSVKGNRSQEYLLAALKGRGLR